MNEDNSYTFNSVLNEGSIVPGSKRLQIGQAGKSPVEIIDEFMTDPAALSVAVHELTHFHSLISPLGIVLSARAAMRGHLLTETLAMLQAGAPDADLLLAKAIRDTFELERLVAAYEPLLEGAAVLVQSGFPCDALDEFSRPVRDLVWFALALFALDSTPAHQKDPMKVQSFITQVNTSLRTGPGYPFDSSSPTLAVSLELEPTARTLPYFLGHAYLRGVQARVSRVLDWCQCPERFFELFMRLLWARRTGPRRYEQKSQMWVDMVYSWNSLFDKASVSRLQAIDDIGYGADVLEWLLDEGVDDQPSPVASIGDIDAFLQQRLGDWELLVEGQDNFREALPNIVRVTHMMNLSFEGSCSIVGYRSDGPTSGDVALIVEPHVLWFMNCPAAVLARMGVDVAALPSLSPQALMDGAPGHELRISSFVTEGQFGLGPGVFPRGSDHHYLFWVAPAGGWEVGALFQLQLDDDAQSARLAHVTNDQTQDVFRVYPALMQLLEHDARRKSLAAWLEEHAQWSGLKQSMAESENRQRAACDGIRKIWTRQILVDLLGTRAAALEDVILAERMRPVILDVPRMKSLLTSSYSAPIALEGPGADDNIAMLEVANELAVARFGQPVFLLEPPIVQYLGLWGGRLLESS